MNHATNAIALLLGSVVMTSACSAPHTTGNTDVAKATAERMSGNPAYRWQIPAPITRWDEAIPLGNGLTGCLVWGEKNRLRFSFDRGDLWDNRKPKEILEPGFTYANLQKLVKEKNTREIGRLTDKPYGSPYPTKLPGVRLEVTLRPAFVATAFDLDMGRALATVRAEADPPVIVFTGATHPVTLIRCPAYSDAALKAPTSIRKLGYPPPETGRDGNDLWWRQKTQEKLAYGAHVAVGRAGKETLLAVSFTSNKDADDFMALAKRNARQALKTGFDAMLAEHAAWWLDFWSASDLSLPDLKHERYYRLMQYFYGAASRKGFPPMPLQGLWTADAGGLPPWKGDFHNDMNVQMCYWAYCTSGRFACGESLIDFLVGLAPTHRRFARDFFGVDGLLVPGVMGLDGQPLTGWAQYSLSPTMSVWLLQNLHWHWRHTMDRKMLAETIYPYCREMASAMQALLRTDAAGHLKMPLSSSPEIHNNSLRAWLTPNTNNDLALLHWMADAMAEMAGALARADDMKRWKDLRSKLEPLAVDERHVLRLAPDESLKGSHRHHAHLMAIHPLGTLSIEGGDRDRQVVLASLDNLRKLGSQAWVGFSFPWAACLEARAGRAGEAFRYLDIYVDCFTSVNGFNLNGQQRGKERHSGFRYRPFTLDANFGAAQAVHEMLLQSWGDTVRVFPCVPDAWGEVAFDRFRAEGGFVVSADRKAGRTTQVEIAATVDRTLRLRNPFGAAGVDWNREVKRDGNDLLVDLKAGETLTGRVMP